MSDADALALVVRPLVWSALAIAVVSVLYVAARHVAKAIGRCCVRCDAQVRDVTAFISNSDIPKPLSAEEASRLQ